MRSWFFGCFMLVCLQLLGVQCFGVQCFGVQCASAQEVDFALSDKSGTLRAPTDWKFAADLNEQAELQITNISKDFYLIVMAEDKSDLVDMDLTKYADAGVGGMVAALKSPEQGPLYEVSVGGLKGLQRGITGQASNLKIAYIHTSIEGSKNYYQILGWTKRSQLSTFTPMYNRMLESFKETPTGAASSSLSSSKTE